MDPILQKFRDKFIEEAHTILDHLEKDLLQIEKDPDNRELNESAFRAMHTLKGISSMYGFDHISEFTHHLESIWQAIRDNICSLNKEISELTFNAIDHIRKLLDDEKLENKENLNNHKALLNAVANISKTNIKDNIVHTEKVADIKKSTHTWQIILRLNEMLFFRGISIKNIISDLELLGSYEMSRIDDQCDSETDVWNFFLTTEATEDDIKEVLLFIEDDYTLVNLTDTDIVTNEGKNKLLKNSNPNISLLDYFNNVKSEVQCNSVVLAEEKYIQSTENTSKQFVKRISVDSEKLDQLMFLVSELITLNSQLIQTSRFGSMEQMIPQLEKVDNLSKLFRNNALEIRLVPLEDTVLRFQRLIRDLSKQLGKKVEFKTTGTDTELDKNTIDRLAEPLMHIIRNCIDHGIEQPEQRIKKGKPEIGIIGLTAYNSGSNVYICISDDGTGIDEAKVKQKAIDRKIIEAKDNPTQKEIFDFIFLPGFSTAESLTSVSGRGVGMDVVKKRISDLRGEISISSDLGIGTSFTLKLPQSLSIIDTLLFQVDDMHFTVPISEIEVCIQPENFDLTNRNNTKTIPYKDQLIPFVDLRYLLNLGGNMPENSKIIIIRNENKELALLSDYIVGEHQAVLKPLGKSFNEQQYITSASQLGDGKMAFMIDTNALLKLNSY